MVFCAESLRLIISLENTSGKATKARPGRQDLGGYQEYKKTLISSPTSAAASLCLAHGWATALHIEASIGNTLANCSLHWQHSWKLQLLFLSNLEALTVQLLYRPQDLAWSCNKATLLQNIQVFGQPSCVSPIVSGLSVKSSASKGPACFWWQATLLYMLNSLWATLLKIFSSLWATILQLNHCL